jgi:type IX secretion system PorP/SprF family membrane protein
MKNTITMTWKNVLGLFVLLVLTNFQLHAQDLRYSQYFNTPYLLNPALTGMTPGDFRLGVIHRKQWTVLQNPYTSSSVFGDFNFRRKGKALNKIGIGFAMSNDNVGNGIFINNQVLVSSAFQFRVNQSASKTISFGVQGGLVSKNLDKSKFLFASQFNPDLFSLDINNPSGEKLALTASVPLLHVGTVFNNKVSDKLNYSIGIGAYNLIPNKEDYVDNITGNAVKNSSFKTQANLGLNYKLTSYLTLSPQALIALQGGSREVNAGLIAQLNTGLKAGKNPVGAEAGLFYRFGDAGVAYGAAIVNNFKLGISYDFSLSQVKDIQQGESNLYSGSYEISLTYVGFLQRLIPGPVTIPCTTF